MYTLISTLVVSSLIVLSGCQKTNPAAITQSSPEVLVSQTQEHEVEATIEENVLVLNIKGEEQVIDLSEMMGDFELDSMDGSVEIHVELDADSLEELPEGIQEHIMKMMGEYRGGQDAHAMMYSWSTEDPQQGNMPMMGGEHGNPQMMREIHERMMEGGHGNSEGDMRFAEGRRMDMLQHGPEEIHQMHGQRGEWMERDVPEEVEFMHKVRMYHEVSQHLAESEAMSLLGVHMLRNGVEPDLRLELLEEIINELPDGDAARNGAILVAIETLHEIGEEEEAARLMAELVLSNSNVDEEYWDDDEWEDDD